MIKIVASGLSGLIGAPLLAELSKKYEVVLLSRNISNKEPLLPNVRKILWNGRDFSSGWAKELEGAYAVINLSGEPIAGKRWSSEQKEKIRTSRVHATRAVVEAISKAQQKPKLLLNASAIGFYGDRQDERLVEASLAGVGFLPEVCGEWEKEAEKARVGGVRVVTLRTGIVLSKKGGALAKMLPPFQFFIGGPLGSGKQVLSWIHIDDEVNAILWALKNEKLDGPLNLTAPNPVSMNEFSKMLGRVLHRPCFSRVPALALKMLLGEMSDLLLQGQRVYPEKLLKEGFSFRYPSLEPALTGLLSK